MGTRSLLLITATVILARNSLGQDVAPTPSAAKLPIEIVVRLPADAELELMGKKMLGSGAVRKFRTAPVEVDKDFKYTFRATWTVDGQTRMTERELAVRAGQVFDVDLHDSDVSTEERAVLDLVNQERAKRELKQLVFSGKLMRAARKHAANMASINELSHPLDGKDFWQRILDEGYSQGESAENIAQGARTPERVVAMWIDSPGHRENMLHPNYVEFGVGVATAASGDRFWVQVFATPPQQFMPADQLQQETDR